MNDAEKKRAEELLTASEGFLTVVSAFSPPRAGESPIPIDFNILWHTVESHVAKAAAWLAETRGLMNVAMQKQIIDANAAAGTLPVKERNDAERN